MTNNIEQALPASSAVASTTKVPKNLWQLMFFIPSLMLLVLMTVAMGVYITYDVYRDELRENVITAQDQIISKQNEIISFQETTLEEALPKVGKGKLENSWDWVADGTVSNKDWLVEGTAHNWRKVTSLFD